MIFNILKMFYNLFKHVKESKFQKSTKYEEPLATSQSYLKVLQEFLKTFPMFGAWRSLFQNVLGF